MCGIVGIFGGNRALIKEEIILAMRDSIRHRGPDDAGVEVLIEEGVALGHVRLSILDLTSAGHQPMWSSDKSIAIVFNGEIYNFRELRQELVMLGCKFHTESDTEVLLKGYELWGADVVHKLNGMFAFAIWDSKLSRLWLVRDRLGVKPLYYYYDSINSLFIFASEIKAILKHPSVSKEINPDAVESYFSLGYVLPDITMFKGINKLPAAHAIFIENAEPPNIYQYWDILEIGALQNVSENDLKDEVRNLFQQAVKRRLVSDVPIGALLSGGIDSTLTVGVMSQLSSEQVRTFSTAFQVGDRSFKYNLDADYAELVSCRFKTKHTRLTIETNKDLINTIRQCVRIMDEPHGNPTCITTMLMAEHIKRDGISVILSGDGSDEIFGGYARYQNDYLINLIQKIPSKLRNPILYISQKVSSSSKLTSVLLRAKLKPLTPLRIMSWWYIFKPDALKNILTNKYKSDESFVNRAILKVLNRISSRESVDNLDAMLYTDLMLWITEENNMRMDKTTMAVGLETRAPFLDYRLVEYVMSIPFSIKAGWKREKHLLKSAFSDLLPKEILKRKKMGWQSPVFYWLRDDLWDDACRLIKKLPDTGIFTPEVISYSEEYPPKNPNQVWLLLVFAIWYEEYIE